MNQRLAPGVPVPSSSDFSKEGGDPVAKKPPKGGKKGGKKY